jgi:hypothetical protein
VLLDANALVYHFSPLPPFGVACDQSVRRVQSQELLVFTSTQILTEVACRLVTFEAGPLAGWTACKVMHWLRQQTAPLPSGDLVWSGFSISLGSWFGSRR